MISAKDLWPVIKDNLPVALAGVAIGCILTYSIYSAVDANLNKQRVEILNERLALKGEEYASLESKIGDKNAALKNCQGTTKELADKKDELISENSRTQSEYNTAIIQLNECNAGAEKMSEDATKLVRLESRLSTQESQLELIKGSTEIAFFVTGDSNPGSGGTYFGCYQDQTAPAVVCGDSSSPISVGRYKSVRGGRCGFNYYAVACAPSE